jgi:hypothetical protein
LIQEPAKATGSRSNNRSVIFEDFEAKRKEQQEAVDKLKYANLIKKQEREVQQ